jgi:DHA3 family macrolide efflux protein-like MFS transporter
VSHPSVAPRGMRTFLTIWLGQLISIVGSGLTSFALGVWIFDRTGQATPFALTVLFGNLPRILLAPIAGSVADRQNRRWVMILADTCSALLTLAVVLLLMSGQLAVWHIYLIALVGSAFAAFQEPAYTASIAMLVPKKHLARANGLVQMGQAIEMLVSPALAGALFVAIGLQGIIAIDFATYFFAIGALLLVRIPQPEAPPVETGAQKSQLLQDVRFGWRYLRARTGLLGLLFYFALVNFLLNGAMVLNGPLILSFGTASTLGLVQTVSGIGMLAGSVLMSAWGGPRRRISAVIGFIALGALGLLLMGLRSSGALIGAGMFILLSCVPLASGCSQAIFQTKVAPHVQGRVFAMRAMISRSMMPLAFLSAGPLADYVFEPWMREGGTLARTVLGNLIGVGAGRGIGLMFVMSGVGLLLASGLAFASPHIRRVEDELPDALPDTPGEERKPGDESPAAETVRALPS